MQAPENEEPMTDMQKETEALLEESANLAIRATSFALQTQFAEGFNSKFLGHEYCMVLTYKVLNDIANGVHKASELFGECSTNKWTDKMDEQSQRIASILVGQYETEHEIPFVDLPLDKRQSEEVVED